MVKKILSVAMVIGLSVCAFGDTDNHTLTVTTIDNSTEEPMEAPLLPEVQKSVNPRHGFVPPRIDLSHLKADQMPAELKGLRAPSRWDWRESGAVTPVRDQGYCGSCYAFASIANIESRLLIDGDGEWDLSENNAKECNWFETSCDGGSYFKLASWFSEKGVVLESCDPYVASDVSCNTTCPYVKTLLDWRIISGSNVPSTSVLQNYIMTYGPVKVSFYAGDGDAWNTEFGNYNGSYTLYYPGTEDNNHAVLIVGWDDDLTHVGGTGGWIVKNSWGTDWGGTCGYGTEKGYFTIAYGSAGIGKYSRFMLEWQNYDHYGGILLYDEAGWRSNLGYNDYTAWGMCKFVPSSDITLTRAEFWINDATTDVDVYVYGNFNGSSLSNLLASELNYSYSEAGYHSVALSSQLDISSGDDFYIAIKFDNVSYGYPIAVDGDSPWETNMTYVSHYGSTWSEVGTAYNIDVAIRARYQTATCIDSDADGYGDAGHPENDCPTDNCPDVYNIDQTDSDADGFGDVCDICQGYDDNVDTDTDGVPNGCDACEGFDDAFDTDTDGVPDGCDICAGHDDNADADTDGVPDGCDLCPGHDDLIDTDEDGVPDGCDICPGFDDNGPDADGDTVPDDCDVCEGFDDLVDPDEDGVPSGCDNCPEDANPDQADHNNDEIGDACCCEDRVGDANGVGGDEPTIGDISTMIDALFIDSDPVVIACLAEADVNQSGGADPQPKDITISDISTLIDYLFITGPELGLSECL